MRLSEKFLPVYLPRSGQKLADIRDRDEIHWFAALQVIRPIMASLSFRGEATDGRIDAMVQAGFLNIDVYDTLSENDRGEVVDCVAVEVRLWSPLEKDYFMIDVMSDLSLSVLVSFLDEWFDEN